MRDPILYVEDGPDDILFMQRAFRKIAPDARLRIITNGQEAADFFDPAKNEAATATPLSLVLLDLNLPGRSGLEVLSQIKRRSSYKTVPVILFSASDQQQDIDACYMEGCNAYLVKPNNPEGLRTMVSVITDFWLKANRFSSLPTVASFLSESDRDSNADSEQSAA